MHKFQTQKCMFICLSRLILINPCCAMYIIYGLDAVTEYVIVIQSKIGINLINIWMYLYEFWQIPCRKL